jgi:hypothetical protein
MAMTDRRRALYRRIVAGLKSVGVDVHAIREMNAAIASVREGEIEFSMPFEVLCAFTGDENDLARSPNVLACIR